jgi:serine phosphatase RsbU (regulator of sigma subunit)
LRAVRNALTPPELASRPGVDLAASFLPATDGVSGDFYLVADGPHEATALVVGDVVGKGLGAARRAAFIRTVFATTAPFSGVLLYTDGVTEARHNGDQFGQTRLAQLVQSFKGQAPSEVVAAVTTEVHRFADTRLADDLCVVAARIGEG